MSTDHASRRSEVWIARCLLLLGAGFAGVTGVDLMLGRRLEALGVALLAVTNILYAVNVRRPTPFGVTSTDARQSRWWAHLFQVATFSFALGFQVWRLIVSHSAR